MAAWVSAPANPPIVGIAVSQAARPSRRPVTRGDVRYRFVVRLVAFATGIPVERIDSRDRGSADVSRARHLAMYLLHTKLSLCFADIARCFGRDRTTIAHACSAIEDLRDIPERDDFVADLEAMLDLAMSMAAPPVRPVRQLAVAE